MSEPIVIQMSPGFPLEGDFEVRVTAAHVDEVTQALQDAGFEPDRALAHGKASTGLEVFLLVFDKAGGLDGLAKVLATVLARHEGKRFVVRGQDLEIVADGYSATAVRKMLGALKELIDERDAAAQRQGEAGD